VSKQIVISARIDAETSAKLDALAEQSDRSRAWLVADAVREMIQREDELMAFLQLGLDDIAAGRVHTQEDMEIWLAEKLAGLRQAQKHAA
jgi:predicted transcriptional regulator